MTKEKQTKNPLKTNYVKSTPQSMADGLRFYAKTITETVNKFSCRQNDSKLASLYVLYLLRIRYWRNLAKKELNKDLPPEPEPPGNDYFAGIVHLAKWFTNCEAILRGDKIDEPNKTNDTGDAELK